MIEWTNEALTMAESFLHYTEAFERPGLIRVDVCGDHDNLSWAILDMKTGEVVEECKRGAFLFPGLMQSLQRHSKLSNLFVQHHTTPLIFV